MKCACFIPIKAKSERVPRKNFRLLNGKRLFEHIIEHCIEAKCFDDIYVDTDSSEIKEYCSKIGVGIIDRLPFLASNEANGNDLMVHWQNLFPDYDCYFMAHATAPFLQIESIRNCANLLKDNSEYDSCFTAIKQHGWFWLGRHPVNFQPYILPRSQDADPMIEETTGLYGIRKDSLLKYKCRIGRNPAMFFVNKFEAIDIDTEEDFKIAEMIGKEIWKR